MFKQLNRINQIDEESNQSQSQQEILLNISEETKEKLQLVKIGQQETDNLQYDQQNQGFIGFNGRFADNKKKARNPAQIDLDSYLQLQRDHLSQGKAKVRRKPKTAEQIEKQKQFTEGYGKGFKIAMKMGLNIGKGLGKNQQGRTNIVEAEFKTSLTKRDQDYESQAQKKSIQQKQQQQEFNQNKHQQIFNFRSRKYHINQLLIELKSKYELSKSKVEVIRRNKQSIQKDKQYNTNVLLQKQNQLSVLNQQILGLGSISRNIENLQQFPHLVIQYNIDLFVVKQAIQKLSCVGLNIIANPLKQEIKRVRKILNRLYIEKEKQSLKQYNQISGIEEKMKQFFQKNKQINNIKFNQQFKSQELIEISQEDKRKIEGFIKLIIQETTIKNKLEVYLESMKDFDTWQEWLIDLIDVIHKNDEESGKSIKTKFLIPKANSFLAHYKYEPQKKRLPHLVIFPWMIIIRLEQLKIQGFFINLMVKIWDIQKDDLYNIVYPWIKHANKSKSQQFINFYLAPRLLYEMENCSLTERDSKQKIKGFLKYSQLIPSSLRDQIIQNTLAIQLLEKYEQQLKKNSANRKQLDEWVKKWVSKFDLNDKGLLRKYFTENGHSSIWDF